MTAPDPLVGLLDGLRVPAMPAMLADRIAAEAARPDRVPAPLPPPAPRRPLRRWTRRGVWTTVVAVNLVLASAVAAAIGGGVIDPHRIVAAAHRLVAHIHHPHAEHAPARTAPAPHRVAASIRPAAAPPPIRDRALTRPLAAPPVRALAMPRPALPVAAMASARRLPPMIHPQLRRDRLGHRDHHVDRNAQPSHASRFERPNDRFRHPFAERSPEMTRPAPIRADAPVARDGPPRAEAAPDGTGPRWRQRGWRDWQNRRTADDPSSFDTQRGTDRQRPTAGFTGQQRRGDGFRPGRRFGGGPHRGGGGGRRRF